MTRGTLLWAQVAVGMPCAILLLALVRAPVAGGWPAPPALATGVLAGIALFAALERRAPVLPRPPVGRARVWLAAQVVLALWVGVEEVVWRWAILGQLTRLIPVAAALAVSALGFALCHRAPAAAHLLAGLAFGGVFVGTGSLAAAWLAHVAYNGSVAGACSRGPA